MQQRSFIHTLVVPFLIGMMVLSGYFVFKRNPEIINQESFYKKLSSASDDSDVLVQISPRGADFLHSPPQERLQKLSHRYVPAKPDAFKGVPYSDERGDWKIVKTLILTKNANQISASSLDGTIIWSFKAPEGQRFMDGPISEEGSGLVLTTDVGNLFLFDLTNGELIWYLENNRSFIKPAALHNGQIITYYEDKPGQTWALDVLDAASGKYLRTIKKLEYPLAGMPTMQDRFLFYATVSGRIHGLDLTSGNATWTSEGTSSFRSGPTVIGEKLYISNEDGLLLSFDKKNGRKGAEIELGTRVDEPIQIVEGTNYGLAVDVNGYLLAVDLKANKRIWRYHLNMAGSQKLNLIRLSTQSLNQLSFVSSVGGWSAWTSCSNSRICIFDVKEGRLLHRIELNAKPIGHFEVERGNSMLYVPVSDKGEGKIMALEEYVKPPSANPSTVVK